MKKLFIFLNILLAGCVCWLVYTHVSYEPPPPEKVLEMTPPGPNIIKQGIFARENVTVPSELSYIYENSVFLPNRGVVENENGDGKSATVAEKVYRGNFELTAICKIGKTQGAVISGTGSRSSKSFRAKFYRINDNIGGTTFKLVEVSPEEGTVTISGGTSRSILELDRDDAESSKRRTTEVKRQETVAKKAEMDLKKKITIPPSIASAAKFKPAVETKKPKGKKPMTAEDVAEIRKKILERMAAKKKKNPNNRKK